MEKYGFVYVWHDVKKKMFYIGSHWGTEDDGYICSSKRMRDNHRNRPDTFKRKVVGNKVYTNRSDLLDEEQRWLDMIPRKEFGKKYYNISSSAKKGAWWANEETKKIVGAKISACPTCNANISKGNKGKVRSLETKAKLSVIAKAQYNDPEFQRKYKAGIKTRKLNRNYDDPEFRRKCREGALRRIKNGTHNFLKLI